MKKSYFKKPISDWIKKRIKDRPILPIGRERQWLHICIKDTWTNDMND